MKTMEELYKYPEEEKCSCEGCYYHKSVLVCPQDCQTVCDNENIIFREESKIIIKGIKYV